LNLKIDPAYPQETIINDNLTESPAGINRSYGTGLSGLTDGFTLISNQIKALPDETSQNEAVDIITEEFIEYLADYIRDQFPVLQPVPEKGNPLGNLAAFYNEAERRNSLGIGSLFRLEWFAWPLRSTSLYEIKNVRIIAGRDKSKIKFRELLKFEGQEIVSHEIIKDDKVIYDFNKREGFSYFHDLPSQLRRDGVNDIIVGLTEEVVKLINFHLWKNYNQNGLDMPADHPQLAVPEGYTPDVFRSNFSALLMRLIADYQRQNTPGVEPGEMVF
jgi:hypothetical protein